MSLKDTDTITRIERQFGKGVISQLGSKDLNPISVISTGSPKLDHAIGVGGLPRGRVIEIFGPESGGKTTLALQVIAQAQKMGEEAAILDVEHALSPEYAGMLGVDVPSLWVSQPSCGEEALEITESLIKSKTVAIVVVDSVSMLVPRAELEGDFGDAQMGLQARMMSQAMRKLTEVTHKSNCILLFINQIREKIGVSFGPTETTSGGRALRFAASVRLDIRRISAIKDGDVVVGARTRIKVVKNKVGSPFREAEVDLLYGKGISREGDLIDMGTEFGIIEKSGSWLTVLGERFQGREKAVAALAESPELAGKLETAVREKLSA